MIDTFLSGSVRFNKDGFGAFSHLTLGTEGTGVALTGLTGEGCIESDGG